MVYFLVGKSSASVQQPRSNAMEQLSNIAPEKSGGGLMDPSVASARYNSMMAAYFRDVINPAKYPGLETDPVMQQLYYQVRLHYSNYSSIQ
jgi:hypothetical protein